MDTGKFRVIIVGAGPVGLYLAHALSLANIDYVILEQQKAVMNVSGQLIFTWPQTVRLFDQIGLYEGIKEAAIPLNAKSRVYGPDGRIMTTSHFWTRMIDNHGYPFLPLLRSEIVRVLYTSLKDKESRIKVSAEVVDIQTTPDGVSVSLKDGTVEKGSIVIGADGVHSKTRSLMQALAQIATGKAVDVDPMLSTFHGIFARGSNDDARVPPGVLFESRGSGAVIQCTATKDTVHFVTLKPLPSPTTERIRFTPKQMDEYAASLSHISICPGVKFQDLWRAADKSSARMLCQEEGFLETWHHDRIVLVGDAAHKGTSVNGLGLTCALHSAASLVNELQALLASRPSHPPSTDLLDQAFGRYQTVRQAEAKPIWQQGHAMVREVTSAGWRTWFWDNYVLPWFDVETFGWGILVSLFVIRHGQMLQYVPFKGGHGSVAWVNSPRV
ncbi:FAD/NAD(P)-binding domain-containing protein [Aspergillus californicus]